MTLTPMTPAPLDVAFSLEEASLEVASSPVRPEGQRLHLGETRVVVGREFGVTLRFEERRLSRRHAELRREGDGFVVLDLSSTNGTWVNGVRVTRQRLQHGDSLRLGATVLVFIDRRLNAAAQKRAEVQAANACIAGNFESLQLALAETALTQEALAEARLDCALAAQRLERYARREGETTGERTPVVTRATRSHV